MLALAPLLEMVPMYLSPAQAAQANTNEAAMMLRVIVKPPDGAKGTAKTMAKPQTQNQPMRIVEDASVQTVPYLQIRPHMKDGKRVPEKWDLVEGRAVCVPDSEKVLERGQILPVVRGSYDIARAKRHMKKNGDPA